MIDWQKLYLTITKISNLAKFLGFENEIKDFYYSWTRNNYEIKIVPYSKPFDEDKVSNLKNLIVLVDDKSNIDIEIKIKYFVLDDNDFIYIKKIKELLTDEEFDIWFLSIINSNDISRILSLISNLNKINDTNLSLESHAEQSNLENFKSKEISKKSEKNAEETDKSKSVKKDMMKQKNSKLDFDLIMPFIDKTIGKCQKHNKFLIVNTSDTVIVPVVSKNYDRSFKYWFSIHSYQLDFMKDHKNSFILFELGDKKACYLVPSQNFLDILSRLTISPNSGDPYYHVYFVDHDNTLKLKLKDKSFYDISSYYYSLDDNYDNLDLSLKYGANQNKETDENNKSEIKELVLSPSASFKKIKLH